MQDIKDDIKNKINVILTSAYQMLEVTPDQGDCIHFLIEKARLIEKKNKRNKRLFV